jgi:FixJ family two-component response regulator
MILRVRSGLGSSAGSKGGIDMAKPTLIAIVDDDESLRRAVKRLIQSYGLRAETFASADDFLYSGRLQDTACLILDVVIPGTSGPDLQRMLISAKKNVPIVFMAAYADDDTRQSALDHGAVAFLDKPFSDDALLATVRSVLEGGQNPSSLQ